MKTKVVALLALLSLNSFADYSTSPARADRILRQREKSLDTQREEYIEKADRESTKVQSKMNADKEKLEIKKQRTLNQLEEEEDMIE